MAGMRILQEGGNAFDAAVAIAAAVGVLDPRMSSIGGNGFATVYVSKTQEVRALNFYGSAPKRATVSLYLSLATPLLNPAQRRPIPMRT
jgi:gamma-glutamyltranspeptidase/glutathione hydrolase